MLYKPRKVIVQVRNDGRETFHGKLLIDIPYYKEQVLDIEIPAGQTIEVESEFDEYLIPKRRYTVTAKITDTEVYDEKSAEVEKKTPNGFLDFFVNRSKFKVTWKKGCYIFHGCWRYVRWGKDFMIFTFTKHGTSSYLEVWYHDMYGFLEPGFNYELEVTVIEQASFCYSDSCSCVSYPNTYTTAFVNICGPQNDIWDYVYHDKSEPEVRLYLGGNKIYNTIMTAAYKGYYGWISDTYVKDTFTLVLEQVDEKTYRWKITNFKRTTGKSGRKVLANVDYRKTEGEFGLGGVVGTDATGKKIDITNVIPIRFEAYTRVGRSADVNYSAWPYCRTEVYIRVKKVY